MTEPDGIVERIRLAAYAWVEEDDRLLLVRLARNLSLVPGVSGACRPLECCW